MTETKNTKPKVELLSLGKAQAGTFIGSKTGDDGVTRKVVVDDGACNSLLVPPPDLNPDAALVGGVNVEVVAGIDYKPIMVATNRIRTCCITIATIVTPINPDTVTPKV
jgi:hypothetical protein